MHGICSSIIASICVYVCSHYRKVKRIYDVYHDIFSLVTGRGFVFKYPSYVLSTEGAIDCTQVQSWVVGGYGEECRQEKIVAGQFADKYKDETFCWTKKLSTEDYCCLPRVSL